MQSLSAIISRSPVRVMPDRYVVAKCADIPSGSDFFMVARDADEVTLIAEESELDGIALLGMEGDYRLLEIRMATPFQGVGFLATVSRAIADVGLNIFIVSTYSKDYILLKEHSVPKGLEALASLGFPIVNG